MVKFSAVCGYLVYFGAVLLFSDAPLFILQSIFSHFVYYNGPFLVSYCRDNVKPYAVVQCEVKIPGKILFNQADEGGKGGQLLGGLFWEKNKIFPGNYLEILPGIERLENF